MDLAVLLLVAGCVWVWSAVSRLFLFDFHEIPLRTLEELRGGDLNHPILVLGLPRSGKDTAVREFIDRIESAAAPPQSDEPRREPLQARVDLKTENMEENWLKQGVRDLGLETFSQPPAVDIRPVASPPAAATAVATGRQCLADAGTSPAATARRRGIQGRNPLGRSPDS